MFVLTVVICTYVYEKALKMYLMLKFKTHIKKYYASKHRICNVLEKFIKRF